MGTKLLSSSGGKEFDGTDYIYVYGDGDPMANGQELQSALFQAGIDKVATGRRQTVVVGPGTYLPGSIGSYFTYDPQATRIVSLTENRDVNLQHAGSAKTLSLNSTSGSAPFEFNSTGINEVLYEASSLYPQLGQNQKCYSDYTELEDGSLILFNEQNGNYRFFKITSTGYTLGQPLGIFYPNWNVDRYWVIKNHNTGNREIFALGYYPPTNGRVLLKIDTNTLAYDPIFYVATNSGGFINDIVSTGDGGYILAGQFNSINGTGCLNIAKINSNGVYDTSFVTGIGLNSSAMSAAYNPNLNLVYVGGNFSSYNGVTSKYLAIIDVSNGALVTPGSVGPNNMITAIKYFENTNLVYAFGYFSQWGGSVPTNSRHAIINLDGTYNSVLFNDYLGNVNNDAQVMGDVDGVCTGDAKDRIRLINLNQSAFFVNSIPTFYGALIEIETTNISNTKSYSLLPLSSQYGTSIVVAYNPYASKTGFVLGNGSFYYGNLKILDASTNTYYSNYSNPSDDLVGLNIKGNTVINTQNVQQYYVDNCSFDSITDSYTYDNSYGNVSLQFEIKNSKVTNLIIVCNLTINDSYIANAFTPLPGLSAGFMQFGFMSANNSTINNMYNGPGAFIPGCNMTNCSLNNSFNNGYRYVTPSTNNYTNVYDVIFKNCYVNSSFQDAKLPRFQIHNCEIVYSFYFGPYANNVDLLYVRDSGWSWTGIMNNTTAINAFTYDFSTLISSSPVDTYYQQVDMEFNNCSLSQGSLSFIGIPSEGMRKLHFVNCNHNNQQADRSMYMSIVPNVGATGYFWGSGQMGNVKFQNCHTQDVRDAFVVKLYVPFNVTGQLYVYDVTFDGCTFERSNFYGDTQINSVFNFEIEPLFGSTISNLIFHKIRAFNCTVSADFTIAAFFSNYYNLQNMEINDAYFGNCVINHNNAYNYTSFTSGAFFSLITASSLNIGGIGIGLVFENCSTISNQTATYAFTPTSDWFKSFANGFLAFLNIGSFSNNSSYSAVKFLNCRADSGFFNGENYIGGSVYIYAKDCTAMWGRAFGKRALNLAGTFINCDGNSESLGDAYLNAGSYYATYANVRFIGCTGANSFGLEVFNAGATYINNGGQLYHNTAPNGYNTTANIGWGSQAYNVN